MTKSYYKCMLKGNRGLHQSTRSFMTISDGKNSMSVNSINFVGMCWCDGVMIGVGCGSGKGQGYVTFLDTLNHSFRNGCPDSIEQVGYPTE